VRRNCGIEFLHKKNAKTGKTENSRAKKLRNRFSSHEKRKNRQKWEFSCEETAESSFFTRKTQKQPKLKILVRRNCGIQFLHTKNAKTRNLKFFSTFSTFV